MKRIIATALAAVVVAAGIILGIVGPASAHTPGGSRTCDGITLTATAYQTNQTNRWSMTVNGVTESGTFDSSFSRTIPVPQNGATTSWAVSIDVVQSNQYDYYRFGTVGPCGEAPPPVVPPTPPTPPTPPVVPPVPPAPKHAHARAAMADHCNCYRDWVKVYPGKHATLVKSSHPTKTTWKFTLKADAGYLLPNTIDGNRGWDEVQTYVFHTTNKPCPCKVRGDCHELYPNYPGPKDPCRGKDC